MPKHKSRRSRSFVGNHIDPEKANELKGTKTEIDGKVQKILNILKEGDDNDRKESLTDMIEDFHNHYQSLYASYDHLTEELRKKAHDKHEKNTSSSSSSDSSDTDDSHRKKGQKNGKVKNNLETNNTAVVKEELEMAILEVGELKRKLAATEDEKEALYLENQSALSKSQEAERIIANFITEGEKWNEERLKLSTENADLKVELESSRNIQTELTQRLENLEKERESLISEKDAAWFSIEEEKINVEELRTINSELQQKKENLQLELEVANGLLSTLKEDFESSKIELIKLGQMQKTAEEENSKLSSKISHLEQEIKIYENKNHDLVTETSRLSEELVERERELSHHLEIHEAYKEETSACIKDLELQIVYKENEALSQIKKLEDQISSKVTIEKKMEEVQNNASIQIAALQEQVKSSEKKIDEITDQFNKDIDAKNQEIYQLEENVDELKSELEMKVDEINRLVDNMRTTEVKHRLTSQKLRISEQLLGENEDGQLKRVEKLQYDQKLLEEKIAVLSSIASAYKEAQVNVVAEISEKVNGTLMGIDTFSMKFEEDYGHLESRIYEIMNELKFTRNWIIGNNADKDELKGEILSLVQKLKDGKEKELELMVKISELEKTVKRDRDEMKRLIETVKNVEEKIGEMGKMIEERDEKMGEMEREMKEKDNGILRLCEEKREAIRQLCIWIDYHQNRYEDLRERVLKMRGGQRLVAA